MRKNMHRVLLLVLIGSLLVIGGAATMWVAFPEPSAAQGGSVVFFCENPPEGLLGWSMVQVLMTASGCSPADGICWTDWLADSNPRAWFEHVDSRAPRGTDVGTGSPPGFYTPWSIADGRAVCDVDCDGIDELAAGTWYVNLLARPSMPFYRRLGDVWQAFCGWSFDTSMYFWFFGELDTCKKCRCEDIEPTAAAGATPAPAYTECAVTRLPTEPTNPPPERTPLPPAPQAFVVPWANIRAPREAEGTWHRTGKDFYWLWQTPLVARLWADASVSAPSGCESAEVEVFQTYLLAINGQHICPSPFAEPRTEPHPTNVLYPPEGWDAACTWRTQDKAVNLLWSKLQMPPSQSASWNNYGVTPFTQDWIEIKYKVWLWVTYTCNTYQETVPQFQDLTLRVGLVKAVQPQR